MTSPWYHQHRHFRDLHGRLVEEGFSVVEAWVGRHLRLRLSRNSKEVTVTCSLSPRVANHAVNGTMQQARRGTR